MATRSSGELGSSSRQVITVTEADTPFTLQRSDCPCLIVNTGASSGVTISLPTDCKGGEEVDAAVVVAQDIILDPGSTGSISDGATIGATGSTYLGDALGEKIAITAIDTNDWLITSNQAVASAGAFNEVTPA
jgi:hypothetical protein